MEFNMAACLLSTVRNTPARRSHLTTFWRFLSSSNYSEGEHLSKYSYWKNRYQTQSHDTGFDWFLDSEEMLDFLIKNMEECSVGRNHPLTYLDLGCGTSSLAQKILAHSRTPVSLVLLDYVHEALQFQKQHMSRCAAGVCESSFHLVCADVTSLPFCDSSVHMAVDKGTMDALLKDRAKGHCNAEVMMSEVRRVMAHGGRFLQISDEDPDSRLIFLEQISQNCGDNNDSSVFTESKAVVAGQCQVPSLDTVRVNSRREPGTARRDITPPRKLFSSWSFTVLPSSWNKEYFIFWADTL